MLTLTEWLNQVGFQGRNPFAHKQADDEGDQLQAYFVEHPAYNALLSFDPPRSSILHAPRGAGKSSSRRMFEDYCTGYAAELRPLLVRMLDWLPLITRAGSLHAVQPQHHIEELFQQTVRALAEDKAASWLGSPRNPERSGYLNWMCLTYDCDLTPAQRTLLEQRGWIATHEVERLAPYRMQQMGPVRQLELLVSVLQAIGYHSCFVLLDRIDELFETAADWEAGASLLEPLISNLPLNQITGLAFKYFVPTEIIAVLRRRGSLREDRLDCAELRWDGEEGTELLRALLQNRLSFFSNSQIDSLAAIAAPDLRNVDDILINVANGSPRRLLNLGDTLFHACARAADHNNLLIEQEHLEAALSRHGVEQPLHVIAASIQSAGPHPASATQLPADDSTPAAAPPPLLRIEPDGRIWRGSELIEGWQKLPALQRRLLEYLYEHRGTLCSKNELLEHVWAEKEDPADEDSLHKMAGRLKKFIEPNPREPVYIRRVYGGFYCLDNTAPPPALATSSEHP